MEKSTGADLEHACCFRLRPRCCRALRFPAVEAGPPLFSARVGRCRWGCDACRDASCDDRGVLGALPLFAPRRQKLDLFQDYGSVWYVVLTVVGLPAPVAIGVLNPVVPFPMVEAPQHTSPCAGPWKSSLHAPLDGASLAFGAPLRLTLVPLSVPPKPL